MEANVKSKLNMYIRFLVVFVFAILVCISLIAINGLRRNADASLYAGGIIEKADSLYSARLSFEKSKGLSKELIINSGDIERIEYIINEVLMNRRNTESCLSTYSQNATYEHELRMMLEVRELISMYDSLLSDMLAFGANGDAESAKAMSQELAPVTLEIDAAFQMMSEFINEQVWESAYSSEESSNNTVIILIMLSAAAFATIVFASVFTISTTSRMLNDMPAAQEQAGYHQDQYRSGYAKNEGFVLSELEKCVYDLKIVSYDLSQSVKALKK